MVTINTVVILTLMFLLFITAEIMGFVLKIRDNRLYVVFHFAGGALTYLLFMDIFEVKLLALGLVLIVGILWEIHEWVLWKFFLKKRIYRPGVKDSIGDLIADVLGALSLYVLEIIQIF